jgi:hypothetical protein
MMKWHEKIAQEIGTKHSDTQAVIRSGKKGAKRRTNRRQRRYMKKLEERADKILYEENHGITDYWLE